MVLNAVDFPGADAGLKIAAAIAALPGGVGFVDARGFANPQTLTGFRIPPGVTVQLGPILYTIPASSPTITVNQGARLVGCTTNSPGSCQIKAANGFNKNLITCISTSGASGWWHHGEVEGLRVEGNKANNTIGHCVAAYGIGEVAMIRRCIFQNAAESCLYIHGSQAGTGCVDTVTVNAGRRYGVLFDAFTSGLTLKNVGGDANPATIGFINGSTGGSVCFIDLKHEGIVTGGVVEIHGGGGSSEMALTFIGGNCNTGGQPDAIFLRIGSDVQIANHKITIMGLSTAAHMNTLIDDQKLGKAVRMANVVNHNLVCYDGGQPESLFAAFPGVYTLVNTRSPL